MKRKRNQLFVTALTAAMAVSLLSPAEPAAAAKKVKFNVKKLSLTVGKKKTLKIKNVKKKAKWSIKSGKDKIKLQKKKKASVVVAAKKAGSAKVQAKAALFAAMQANRIGQSPSGNPVSNRIRRVHR